MKQMNDFQLTLVIISFLSLSFIVSNYFTYNRLQSYGIELINLEIAVKQLNENITSIAQVHNNLSKYIKERL